MSSLHLRRLVQNQIDTDALQCVFAHASEYYTYRERPLPGPTKAAEMMALRGGWSPADRYLWGVFRGTEIIGCVDVIRRYEEESDALIGLMLLRDDEKGRGFGRLAYEACEAEMRQWPELRRLWIAVELCNSRVLPFWERMGFVDTGERCEGRASGVPTDVLTMEKPIASHS